MVCRAVQCIVERGRMSDVYSRSCIEEGGRYTRATSSVFETDQNDIVDRDA